MGLEFIFEEKTRVEKSLDTVPLSVALRVSNALQALA
jgi:hypothetical protein